MSQQPTNSTWDELRNALREARQRGDNLEVAFIILSAIALVVGAILGMLFLIGAFIAPFLQYGV